MSRPSPTTHFKELINETVNRTYDGPVPEIVLYRLLSVAEAVFREELKIDSTVQELAGLRLGYALRNEAPKKVSAEAKKGVIAQKLYWVGWGWHPVYDATLEPKKSSSGNKVKHTSNNDTPSTGLSASVLKALVNQLQKEMIRRTLPILLEGKTVHPFVFGHTISIPSGEPNPFALDGDIDGGEIVKRLRFEESVQVYRSCDCYRSSESKKQDGLWDVNTNLCGQATGIGCWSN